MSDYNSFNIYHYILYHNSFNMYHYMSDYNSFNIYHGMTDHNSFNDKDSCLIYYLALDL